MKNRNLRRQLPSAEANFEGWVDNDKLRLVSSSYHVKTQIIVLLFIYNEKNTGCRTYLHTSCRTCCHFCCFTFPLLRKLMSSLV